MKSLVEQMARCWLVGDFLQVASGRRNWRVAEPRAGSFLEFKFLRVHVSLAWALNFEQLFCKSFAGHVYSATALTVSLGSFGHALLARSAQVRRARGVRVVSTLGVPWACERKDGDLGIGSTVQRHRYLGSPCPETCPGESCLALWRHAFMIDSPSIP